MSLFGGNTTVTFGSVIYNLAGPVAERPSYLKDSLIAAIIHNAPSIPDAIRGSYLGSPGVTLRSFTNWAKTSGLNTAIGMQDSALTFAQTIDQTTLITLIPCPSGDTVILQAASIGPAEYTQWADQFVAQNYPSLFGTAYTSTINSSTNVITVTFADTTTTTFTPANYSLTSVYIYASYAILSPAVTDPLVTGTTVYLTSGESMPSTTGWTLDSTSGTVTIWERTDYTGWNSAGTAVTYLRKVMTQDTSGTGSYRIDTQNITEQATGGSIVLIYQKGSGNTAMDALFTPVSDGGSFFPFLPIRLGSQFVSPSFVPDIYALGKQALKKAVNGNIDDVITSVAKNASLANIEDAFIIFGVSLNTGSNSSRTYLYQFFQEVTMGQDLTGSSYLSWQSNWQTVDAQIQQNLLWQAAQSDSTNPLYGTAEPPISPYPTPPTTSIAVNSNGRAGINYSSTVSWNGIIETTGTGLLVPTAVPGTLWFDVVSSSQTKTSLSSTLLRALGSDVLGSQQRVRLNWQVGASHWRTLDIYGLVHNRVLFRGDSITTYAVDALGSATESEFIIPINNMVFSRMPLVDATQMSAECAYIVFTTAVATKQPWYTTTVFKIFIIVIIIIIAVVVSILTAGTGTPGVLGMSAEVGAELGFSGTAALVAGAAANAIAAMVISYIITDVATALLGPKIGPIVGAIWSLAAVGDITDAMSSVPVSAEYSAMMLITNLAQITSAVGNGLAAYMRASAQETMGKIQTLESNYSQDSLQIQQQTDALFGSKDGIVDPSAFSNINQMGAPQLLSVSNTTSTAISIEAADTFLSRTLMTGTDLAGLSLDMIGNFPLITLNTTLPI